MMASHVAGTVTFYIIFTVTGLFSIPERYLPHANPLAVYITTDTVELMAYWGVNQIINMHVNISSVHKAKLSFKSEGNHDGWMVALAPL